ncbi:MAG TPA: NUDIX domain-containing protein [Candidatus Saccharimonadales bacterium]|nr:NUDIX domain-containing protein [Candidatus Saccharimonadales bacterium]
MQHRPVRPGVGVCVLVWRDGKVIIFKRRGSHGANTWAIPAGHLEFGESWEACARREALEEVGVEIKNVHFLAVTNDVLAADHKHYISIWLTADWAANEPRSKEPDKIAEVQWCRLHSLPAPLFEPFWSNLRAIKPELFA